MKMKTETYLDRGWWGAVGGLPLGFLHLYAGDVS